VNARFIYQSHKWLAVAVVVATLGWFISGVVLVLPGHWRTLSPGLTLTSDADPRLSGTPAFEETRVSVPDAIAAVRGQTGTPVRITSVKLRRLPGRLAYEVATFDRVYLVDAVSGVVFTLNEALAAQIAGTTVGPQTPVGPVTIQRTASSAYRGPLPVYRVPVADGKDTVLFISGPPVVVNSSDRLSRPLNSIARWHDFSTLRSLLPESTVRLSLLVFGVGGTLMSVAGTLILILQFLRWRARMTRS